MVGGGGGTCCTVLHVYSFGWFDLSPGIKDGVVLRSEGTHCPPPTSEQQQYHQSVLTYGRFRKVNKQGNRVAVVVYDSV